MPKFMTYQRPTPVNRNAWTGRSGANPYQPVRKGKAAPAVPVAVRSTILPALRSGPKSS